MITTIIGCIVTLNSANGSAFKLFWVAVTVGLFEAIAIDRPIVNKFINRFFIEDSKRKYDEKISYYTKQYEEVIENHRSNELFMAGVNVTITCAEMEKNKYEDEEGIRDFYYARAKRAKDCATGARESNKPHDYILGCNCATTHYINQANARDEMYKRNEEIKKKSENDWLFFYSVITFFCSAFSKRS